jgi:hypothetical protein
MSLDITRRHELTVPKLSQCPSCGLLSIFCLVVGYRLALNRPNRYGSILPPTAWAVLAGIFGTAGLAFGATTLTAKVPLRGALLGSVSTLMFAVLCWRKRIAMVDRPTGPARRVRAKFDVEAGSCCIEGNRLPGSGCVRPERLRLSVLTRAHQKQLCKCAFYSR